MVTRGTPIDPLVYPLAGLLADPPGSVRDHLIAGATIRLDDELRLAEPIEGRLHLTRTNRGILVSAPLRTALVGECSRCLKAIDIPLSLRIDEEALPSIDLASGRPLDAAAEPDAVRLDDHHQLDFETLVREAVSLAEPIAPLCRADCPGLCIVCGEPLEAGRHDHDDEPVDPRLAALRAFRVDGDAGTG